MDMINDYIRQAKRMVNAYREERQKQSDADNARLEADRVYFAKLYSDAQAESAKLQRQVEEAQAMRIKDEEDSKKIDEANEKLFAEAFAICAGA